MDLGAGKIIDVAAAFKYRLIHIATLAIDYRSRTITMNCLQCKQIIKEMFTNDVGNNNLQIILQNAFIDSVTTYCLESRKNSCSR